LEHLTVCPLNSPLRYAKSPHPSASGVYLWGNIGASPYNGNGGNSISLQRIQNITEPIRVIGMTEASGMVQAGTLS